MPFLVLPLVTALVTPDAYGQMIILSTVMLLGTTVFGFGLDTSIFYAAHRGSSSNVAANFASAARLLLFAPIIAGVLFAALAMFGTFTFTGVEPLPLAISIFSSSIFVTGNVYATSIYRLRKSLIRYGVNIVGFSLVQQSTKLALITIGNDPVLAWSIGDLVGSIFVLIQSLPVLISSIRNSATSRRRILRLVKRGLPLVPSRIAQWTLQMSDRALVVGILGTAAGGIYGLAAQIGGLSGIFIIELCRFMLPHLARAGGEGVGTLWVRRALPIQFAASALLASGIAFSGPVLLGLFFHDSFKDGASLIPAFAASACIAGWFYSVTDFVGVTLGKTGRLWIFTVIGGIASVGINLAFLPRFGLIAAALGSVVSYGLMFLCGVLYAWKELQSYAAFTRTTLLYSIVVLASILASVPFASANNFVVAAIGLGLTVPSGVLVIAFHHRFNSKV
ncbi:polysaccharide biosynthesis C-terminal domain-containing protein [Arthrobacter sp. M-10]|uniref:oligosaccharide flippase family protein n=1 Tax=Arthrobacter sp. M-10 TaxID=3233037 RepID=UPI003F90DABB